MSTAYFELIVQQDLDTGTGDVSKRAPGGGTQTGTQIGIHSLGINQTATTATWNPASIANGASEDKDITVSGAALGDFVIVSFSLDVVGLVLTAQVTNTNTITATLSNNTGAAVNLASGTVKILVLKSA